jgi:hypothetical protein
MAKKSIYVYETTAGLEICRSESIVEFSKHVPHLQNLKVKNISVKQETIIKEEVSEDATN